MSKNINKLWAINCKYNFKINKNGKCHSTECMFNVDPKVKNSIREKGCLVFKSKEVKKLLSKEGEK